MPGIVGFLTKLPRERAEPRLQRMVDSLCHESFYERGSWIDESLGVYVGWVARQGSFAAQMPLVNERGDVTLVFCGEEFPDPHTTTRLAERGHQISGAGPGYLVHLAEDDENFPAGLNGRFHGLLIDRTRGAAMLFNDRFGMHRLYYHEADDEFMFAAEAKAIIAVRPELREADPRGVGEYLACGCVLENRTLFRQLHVLPPAAAWRFRHGMLERRASYFHPREWEEQERLDPDAYYRELRDVLSKNLPRYFTVSDRIGMSLTGGLDTRMIMAWQGASPGSLPCYTFGGMFRDSQDVVVARRVARACGQPHEVIPVDGEFLARFQRYAERTIYLSDGCADVSRSPDLYVNEKARQIAPVRMTGNYGGEVLRRVRAFKPVLPQLELFHPELVPYIRQAADTYADVISAHPLSFAVFRQAPWHHYGLLALEQTQLSLRSPYLDNDFVRTVFRAPESAIATNEVCLRLIEDGRRQLHGIKTDRGSAFHEFQFKAEYGYDYGMPQWMARIDRVLARLHPERLFLGRHKFYHFRIWYRDALAGYVQDTLLDPKALGRPYINRRQVENVVRAHVKGTRNYTLAIHKLLTLELFHRLFLDSR